MTITEGEFSGYVRVVRRPAEGSSAAIPAQVILADSDAPGAPRATFVLNEDGSVSVTPSHGGIQILAPVVPGTGRADIDLETQGGDVNVVTRNGKTTISRLQVGNLSEPGGAFEMMWAAHLPVTFSGTAIKDVQVTWPTPLPDGQVPHVLAMVADRHAERPTPLGNLNAQAWGISNVGCKVRVRDLESTVRTGDTAIDVLVFRAV